MSENHSNKTGGRKSSQNSKSTTLLQVAWYMLFIYIFFVLIVSANPFFERLRFDRNYEDVYVYFADWMDYFGFLRVVTFVTYVIALVYIFIAVFIYFRKSNDYVGVITSISLMGIPILLLLQFDNSDALPIVQILDGMFMILWITSLIHLLFVFPDGRFVPTVLGLFVRVLIVVFAAGLIYIPIFWAPGYIFLLGMGLLLLLFGIINQTYRFFRVSTYSQRQQSKWIFFSLIVIFFWYVFSWLSLGASLRFEARAMYGLFILFAGMFMTLLLPFAFAVSILRYNLYDIDLVIRRTIQYGSLSGILILVYYAVVLVLQAGVTGLTGEENSPIVTVLSTLAIAALFNPFRYRIQNSVDRRFYRSSYDAEVILQNFADQSRDNVDLSGLSEAVMEVVEKTMHPEKITLWLKNKPDSKHVK